MLFCILKIKLHQKIKKYSHAFAIILSNKIAILVFLLSFITVSNGQITWTHQNSGTTKDLAAVTWAGDLFVAVGDSGTIITSPDGVTWTKRNTGITDPFLTIVWNGSFLLASGISIYGHNTPLFKSSDGISWTKVDTDTSYVGFRSIIWADSTFYAVRGAVFKSRDGINWTLLPGSGEYLYDITWWKGKLVAVGEYYTILVSSDSGKIWHKYLGPFQTDYFAVTGTDSLIVISIASHYHHITSPDGVNWTVQFDTTNFKSVIETGMESIWTGEIIVEADYAAISTSYDGISWTHRFSNDSDDTRGVCFSGEKFVAVGLKGLILTSPQEVSVVSNPPLFKNNHNISIRLQGNRITTIFPTLLQNKCIITGIYSITGKKVFETNLFNVKGKIEYNIANLSSGRYTFVVKGGGLKFLKTFCIIR